MRRVVWESRSECVSHYPRPWQSRGGGGEFTGRLSVCLVFPHDISKIVPARITN